MQYLITVTENVYILEEYETQKVRITKQWVFNDSQDLKHHLDEQHNL